MGEENRRVVKRGLKHNGQWGPSHGPRSRGRVPGKGGEETSRTGQMRQGGGRERTSGQGEESSLGKAERGRKSKHWCLSSSSPWLRRNLWKASGYRVTCEDPNPGLLVQQMPFLS